MKKLAKFLTITFIVGFIFGCGGEGPIDSSPPGNGQEAIRLENRSPGNGLEAKQVSSISELLELLDQDSINVKMAPGTYSITAEDVTEGRIGSASETFSNVRRLFAFEGNNSTYDFTDVKFEIETEVLQTFGRHDVYELHITGSENTIKNLTIEDLGDTHPAKRATSVVVDGRENLLDNIHMTVRGSFPYGYGDAFGKGGGPVIGHHKHSALLIRGESNHIKDCNIIHRSYGHAIFMQAASNPIIEGCYVEGEMRSTDDMLAEEGTGSPADEVDFLTVWGYRLPAGYMLSLGEAGIRAYNAGQTIVDGEHFERGTSNPTVKDCTIKNMRTGVTLAHASGEKYVEGTTAIECENGFSLGSGEVVNSKADATYGPVYSSTYESDRNFNADIEVIPASAPYYNGSGTVAYIGGSDHEITLHGATEALEEGLKIKVGGDKNNIRLLNGNLPHQNNFSASNFQINNFTEYPMVLSDETSGVTGTSCGSIIDEGTNNDINNDGCSDELVDPWNKIDIGGAHFQGSAKGVGGVFNLQGAGNHKNKKKDEYHFVYQKMYGDAVITAKLSSLDAVHPWSTAGLMIREDVNDEESKFVMISKTENKGDLFKSREREGRPFNEVNIAEDREANWLRLERSLDTLTAYRSVNGFEWEQVGQTVIPINDYIYVGMGVSSGNKSKLASAEFRAVTTESPSVHIPQPGKTYYLVSRRWNKKVAADGDGVPYTTSVNTTGANVEWVVKESDVDGYYYLESNGASELSRLASDQSKAIMVNNSTSIPLTRWEFNLVDDGIYWVSTQDKTNPNLQVHNDGNVYVTTGTGSYTRFQFTVVPDPVGK